MASAKAIYRKHRRKFKIGGALAAAGGLAAALASRRVGGLIGARMLTAKTRTGFRVLRGLNSAARGASRTRGVLARFNPRALLAARALSRGGRYGLRVAKRTRTTRALGFA